MSKRQRQQNQERPKWQQKTNKQANKTKNKTTATKREEGVGVKKKQLTEWSSDVVIIIDLRQIEGEN